jgi:hypothetical protein
MRIQQDDFVVAVMHSPREKLWGILRELNPAGMYLRGLDLNSFEDAIRSVNGGESVYGISEQFIPMWRVERVSKDEANGDIPPLYEQFEARTGKTLAEF